MLVRALALAIIAVFLAATFAVLAGSIQSNVTGANTVGEGSHSEIQGASEVNSGLSQPVPVNAPTNPCGALQFDHFTATGTPPVYACDTIAVALFGL